jgi:hypothetical protein
MRCRIRRNDFEVGQLQDGDVQDERQRSSQVSPDSRQQDAGNDDDQRIEKVQRAVDAAGGIHHQRDHHQVGNDLQQRLDAAFFPE